MIYDQCDLGTIPGVKDLAGGGQFPGDCGDTDDPNTLVLLEKFLLPASPIAYRDDMDSELRDAVIEALLDWENRDPESLELYAEASDSGEKGVVLVPYGPDKFTQIEEMCSREELKDICPT
jgi:ABC-type phosphate/phosphonate transport system substrate-binding protein